MRVILFVFVCSCLSLSVLLCLCLFLFFFVCSCFSLSILVCLCLFVVCLIFFSILFYQVSPWDTTPDCHDQWTRQGSSSSVCKFVCEEAASNGDSLVASIFFFFSLLLLLRLPRRVSVCSSFLFLLSFDSPLVHRPCLFSCLKQTHTP